MGRPRAIWMALEAVFRFSCELVSGMSRCSGASYPSPPVQDMVWLTQAMGKSGLRLYDRLHALSVQFWSNAGWGSGPCFEHLQKSLVPSEGGGRAVPILAIVPVLLVLVPALVPVPVSDTYRGPVPLLVKK